MWMGGMSGDEDEDEEEGEANCWPMAEMRL